MPLPASPLCSPIALLSRHLMSLLSSGCFEWYDTYKPQPPGTWQRVYYNNRPGAVTGAYGGNKPCVSESMGAVTVPTEGGDPYAILLSYTPGVTCPDGYRDVQDANECKLLAEQNGAFRC